MDMSEAVRKYPELVQKYFTKAIDENLHKYTALHLAVWSRRIICICA
jgi:feS assembly protein sufB